MIDIKIKDNDRALKDLARLQHLVPRAVSSAMNRAISSTRTEGVRKVRETYTIKYRGLKNEIKIAKANPKKLGASLQVSSRNIPLIQFKTRPTKPPKRQPKVLKVAVKKEGGMKPIKGAFVANLGKHGVGVFQRSGSHRRSPVRELYAPAIPVMLNESGVMEHMMETSEKVMMKRMEHEMNRILGGVIR